MVIRELSLLTCKDFDKCQSIWYGLTVVIKYAV